MTSQRHPDATALAEYKAGLTGGRRARRLAAHVASCDSCASVNDQLTAVTAMLASAPEPAMPDAVESRIIAALATEVALVTEAALVTETPHDTEAAHGTAAKRDTALRPVGGDGGGSRRRPGGGRSGPGNRWLRPAVLASAAAACLALFGGVYGIAHLSSGSSSSSAASSAAGTAEAAGSEVVSAGRSAPSARHPHPPRARRQRAGGGLHCHGERHQLPVGDARPAGARAAIARLQDRRPASRRGRSVGTAQRLRAAPDWADAPQPGRPGDVSRQTRLCDRRDELGVGGRNRLHREQPRTDRVGTAVRVATGPFGRKIMAALAVMAVAVLTACSSPSTDQPVTPSSYYLALGDSLSQGVQPDAAGASVETGQGYPDLVYATLLASHPALRLVRLGCPGETTQTMMHGGICHYSAGSQLAAATAFLRAHRGHVFLVIHRNPTFGANDLEDCGNQPSLTRLASCIAQLPKATAQRGAAILASRCGPRPDAWRPHRRDELLPPPHSPNGAAACSGARPPSSARSSPSRTTTCSSAPTARRGSPWPTCSRPSRPPTSATRSRAARHRIGAPQRGADLPVDVGVRAAAARPEPARQRRWLSRRYRRRDPGGDEAELTVLARKKAIEESPRPRIGSAGCNLNEGTCK